MTRPGADDFTALDERVVRQWRRRGLFFVAAPVGVAAAAAIVVAALFDGPTGGVAVVATMVTGAVSAVALWLPERWYRRWGYRVEDTVLHIRHGAIIRRHSIIPYFRVQHVDTSVGPLERSLGLARLRIHTASSGTDAEIPGLDSAQAAALRAQIVSRAGLNDGV